MARPLDESQITDRIPADDPCHIRLFILSANLSSVAILQNVTVCYRVTIWRNEEARSNRRHLSLISLPVARHWNAFFWSVLIGTGDLITRRPMTED